MHQRLIRQGDHYVLTIAPALIEQAGLTEHTFLEVTVAGSAIVAAPLPHAPATTPAPVASHAESKQAEMLRRIGE